jgi:hypothetical protein
MLQEGPQLGDMVGPLLFCITVYQLFIIISVFIFSISNRFLRRLFFRGTDAQAAKDVEIIMNERWPGNRPSFGCRQM